MRARPIIAVIAVVALSYGVATLWRHASPKLTPTARPKARSEGPARGADARRSPEASRAPGTTPPAAPAPVEPAATQTPQTAALGHGQYQVERTTTRHDLAGEKRVVIENPYGHVVVASGGPQVEVEKTVFARGKDEAEARKKGQAFTVSVARDKRQGFVISVEGDPRDYDVGVNLLVRVPPTAALRAKSGEGDVRVGDMQGSVKAEASMGEVVVGNVKGKVTASTASGNVVVKGAGGGLDAQTSSGNLDLQNAQGASVTARSMSGTIKLRVISTSHLIATTMSSAVDVSIAQPFSGQAEIRSASGDLLVAIPVTSDCKVQTMTGSGPVKSSLPLKDEKHAGPNISGRLGAGKGLLLVTNDSGGIEVKPK